MLNRYQSCVHRCYGNKQVKGDDEMMVIVVTMVMIVMVKHGTYLQWTITAPFAERC